MKTFIIKYETYDGDSRVKEVEAYDEQCAIWKLVNCREVCWTKRKV
jgi:hypothetical protein